MPDVPLVTTQPTEAQGDAGLLRLKPIRHFLNTLMDLVFPPRCAGCGRVDFYWCDACQQAIDQMPPMLALRHADSIAACAASGLHEGRLQDAVHALKYDYARYVAQPLGQRLARCIDRLGWTPDVIIAVPLHEARLRLRGYNQAAVLADVLAHEIQVPAALGLMVRLRDTRSQVGLNGTERQHNVAGAFAAPAGSLQGRSVLLLDDVYTTGATMNACAEAALGAGAAFVYALTVTTAQA